MSKKPLVTVLVTTKDKAEFIGKCLDCVNALNYSNKEVIVVDSLSSDSTCEIASEKNARVIRLSHASIPLAYNTGMREAKGEYVFVVNGDSLVEKGFLERAMDAFENDSTLGGVIGLRKQYSTRTLFSKLYEARFRRLDKTGYIDTLGGNFIVKKEAYERAVGSLDERLVAQEEGFIAGRLRAKGYRILRLNGYSMIHLEEKGSIWEYVKKHAWYAKGKAFHFLHSKKWDADFGLAVALYLVLALFVTGALGGFGVLSVLGVLGILPFAVALISARQASLNVGSSIQVGLVEALSTLVRAAVLPVYVTRSVLSGGK
ncbi:MAG: glycosyltransferase family 2 protein [Candidatus Diapherotrites archaeon]|nr:glycosyltransferase family 2 protein [Candidatus Diapherotrites archaeon]